MRRFNRMADCILAFLCGTHAICWQIYLCYIEKCFTFHLFNVVKVCFRIVKASSLIEFSNYDLFRILETMHTAYF